MNDEAARARIKAWRRAVRESTWDDLLYPTQDAFDYRRRKNIRAMNQSGCSRDRFRSAAWMLGCYRKYGLI